jgi:site-specific recombinase XerD
MIDQISIGPNEMNNIRALRREVLAALREGHYSPRTQKAYFNWIRQYLRFHRRHPLELGAEDIRAFLDQLIESKKISASTHQQTLCAIVFLYRSVLRIEPPWVESLTRPRSPPRLPVVLSRDEVRRMLDSERPRLRARPHRRSRRQRQKRPNSAVSATASRPTSSKPATTFEQSKSSWAIATSAPR